MKQLLTFLLITASLFIPFNSYGSEKDNKSFNRVEKIDFSPNNMQVKGMNISFEFNGFIYEGRGTSFEDVRSGKGKKNVDTELQYVSKFIDVNATGDSSNMVLLWNPSERPSIQDMVKDKDHLSKSVAFFKNIKSSTAIAKLYYGKYILFYIKHELVGYPEYIKIYPFINVSGDLLATNQLVGDPFYDNIAPDLSSYLAK